MPVAFTSEQQTKIKNSLCTAALELVKDTPVSKITVEQLTKAAGISKGAFYKFYSSKEMLFYQLLRQLHDQIYAPALKIFTAGNISSPADAITDAVIQCLDVLDNSEYKRFWMTDAPEIMNAVPRRKQQEQKQAEKQLFSAFLKSCGELAVEESVAFDAITALISTVYLRKTVPENYRTILRRMAQGVCACIFK